MWTRTTASIQKRINGLPGHGVLQACRYLDGRLALRVKNARQEMDLSNLQVPVAPRAIGPRGQALSITTHQGPRRFNRRAPLRW